VVDLLGIWTHIAGQPLDEAPAPLAFVPAIIHRFGAWTIRGGIHLIPQRLAKVAEELGVDIRLNEPVAAIVRDGRRVLGVDLADGTRVNADHVISNAPGISTYTSLLRPPDPQLCADLLSLPLQSPGVSAYLKVQATDAPFLQFLLPRSGKCRLFLCPGAVDDTRQGHARLVSPVDHGWAERVGQAGLSTHLDQLLDESWWKTQVSGFEILSRRLPGDWGRRHHLHRDSMNPVMTARFMRKGRIPHQSPVADNLYLAGSATHPGQWVSFCSISGILAARLATS
jgi:phytoene dehydrogenase-like protein